jgi:hypothetical protein
MLNIYNSFFYIYNILIKFKGYVIAKELKDSFLKKLVNINLKNIG